jgi:hypothetical protein
MSNDIIANLLPGATLIDAVAPGTRRQRHLNAVLHFLFILVIVP